MEQEQINQQKTGETPQEKVTSPQKKVIKKDESWVSTANQQEIVEALSTIDVRTIIQEKYEKNPGNNISLEDFEELFGSETIITLQDAANTNNLDAPQNAAKKIIEDFKDKDLDPKFISMAYHHIHNVWMILFVALDIREKEKQQKNQHKKK